MRKIDWSPIDILATIGIIFGCLIIISLLIYGIFGVNFWVPLAPMDGGRFIILLVLHIGGLVSLGLSTVYFLEQ